MKADESLQYANEYLAKNHISDPIIAKKVLQAYIGLEGCTIGLGGHSHEITTDDVKAARLIIRGLNLLIKKRKTYVQK